MKDDSFPPRAEMPVDELVPIGDRSPAHVELRLACLREAREQTASVHSMRYADVLYRARLNARFVLHGETPGLRMGKDPAAEAGKEGGSDA